MKSSPAPTTFLFGILLVILLVLAFASQVFAQPFERSPRLYEQDLMNGVQIDCHRELGTHQIRVSVRLKMPDRTDPDHTVLGLPDLFSGLTEWTQKSLQRPDGSYPLYEPVFGLIDIEVGDLASETGEEEGPLGEPHIRTHFGTMTFSGYASRAAGFFRKRISLVTVTDIPARPIEKNGQEMSPEKSEKIFIDQFGEAFRYTKGRVFNDPRGMEEAIEDFLKTDDQHLSNRDIFKLLDGNFWANIRGLPIYFGRHHCIF